MIKGIISGNAGKDAKELENGCVFSIASKEKGYVNKAGEQVPDKTTWVSVFANKKLAPYIKKGDYLVVSFKGIEATVYEGKANLSIRAIDIEFGGKSSANKDDIGSNESVSDLKKHMDAEQETDDLPF